MDSFEGPVKSETYRDSVPFSIPSDWEVTSAPNTAGLRDRMYFRGTDSGASFVGKVAHFTHSYLLLSRQGLRRRAESVGELRSEAMISHGAYGCAFAEYSAQTRVLFAIVCSRRGGAPELHFYLSSRAANPTASRRIFWSIFNSMNLSEIDELPVPENLSSMTEFDFSDLL
jgi:hypothetical protein